MDLRVLFSPLFVPYGIYYQQKYKIILKIIVDHPIQGYKKIKHTMTPHGKRKREKYI